MAANRLPIKDGQYHDPEVGPVTKLTYNPATGKHSAQPVTEKFIKGPIPFGWIQAANKLPGRCAHVSIAIWFLVGVKSSKTVKVSAEAIKLSGCTRQTFYKCLTALETKKLVQVVRSPGQRPIVTVLEPLP